MVTVLMKTFQEAKKEADRVGGVVTWWWNFSVHLAADYSYATCGHPKYHSKGAIRFFKNRFKNNLTIKQSVLP